MDDLDEIWNVEPMRRFTQGNLSAALASTRQTGLEGEPCHTHPGFCQTLRRWERSNVRSQTAICAAPTCTIATNQPKRRPGHFSGTFRKKKVDTPAKEKHNLTLRFKFGDVQAGVSAPRCFGPQPISHRRADRPWAS